MHIRFLCALALSPTLPSHTTEAAPKDPEVIFGASTGIVYLQPSLTKYSVDAGKQTTADIF